jgi:hypothetical protein
MAAALAIVDLPQQLLARLSNRHPHVPVLGFGDQVVASVVELDQDVMSGSGADALRGTDAYVCGDFFLVLVEPSIDLL